MPSRQRKHGGGKFKSERQRRFMFANFGSAAKKWAHNRKTRPSDWRGRGKSTAGKLKRRGGGRRRRR